MENQHREIKGYRELNETEIAAMNEVKLKGAELGELVDKLKANKDLDQRWVSIGATALQQGLMALTRAIAKPTFFALAVMLTAGCVSPYKEPSGKFLKLATVETKPALGIGTNTIAYKLLRCDGPSTVVLFYFDADLQPCEEVSREESSVWIYGTSQGQGGQVISGLVNAAALGGVAAAAGSAGNAVSSASTTVINNVPRAHHGYGR